MSNDKTNTSIITILNYLFIFLTINYNLFVKFISGIDSTGYALIFLSVIVIFINGGKFTSLQFSKPIVFWLIWCIFVFINYYIHPHVNPIGILGLYRRIFIPLITITVVVKEYQNNPYRLIWLCFITHIIFVLGGCFLDTGILYRDLGEDNELGNAFATISSLTLFYMMLLNKCCKLKKVWFIIFAIAIITILAMAGVRKAFGAGIILLVFWGVSIINIKRISSWLLMGILLLGGFKGYDYLIDNTFMGKRMEALESQQEDQLLPSDAPQFLYKLGDRAPHYYYGWIMFTDRPLLGVGVGQSRVGDNYIHSEYMVQLTDNGIIGFVLFILLYFWIIKHLLKCLRNKTSLTLCMLGGIMTILFLYITAWGWEFPQYFIILGVVVGYCVCESKNYQYK